MKSWKKCGETKPLSEFHKAAGMRDGHRSECKACHRVRQQSRYQANREHAIAEVKRWQQENKEHLHASRKQYRARRKDEERDARLRRTFGFSTTEYEALLARQEGGCAICRKPPRKIALHVDHDHVTGKIRGLLCVGCNNAIGQFHDDPDLLAKAIEYVSSDVAPFVDSLLVHDIVRERARGLRGLPV